MQTKLFDLGDILSVSHDKLLSERGITGVREVLAFMAGDDSIYTHQLPRLKTICKPAILRQLPQLKEVDLETANRKNFCGWLKEQKKRFGEQLPLAPLEAGEYQEIDRLQELVDMVNEDRVIIASV